jgi:hypothetical protein
MLIAGTPVSVHITQNVGSPVSPNVAGASGPLLNVARN